MFSNDFWLISVWFGFEEHALIILMGSSLIGKFTSLKPLDFKASFLLLLDGFGTIVTESAYWWSWFDHHQASFLPVFWQCMVITFEKGSGGEKIIRHVLYSSHNGWHKKKTVEPFAELNYCSWNTGVTAGCAALSVCVVATPCSDSHMVRVWKILF